MGLFPRAQLDLPLAEAGASRFLTWWSAVMVLMAVLACALALSAAREAQRAALQPKLVTIVLPSPADPAAAEEEMQRLLSGLAAMRGVAFARSVAPSELGLPSGPIEPAAGPPLPRLVDLAVNPGAGLDLATLGARVRSLAPEASLVAGEEAERTGARRAAMLLDLAAVLGVAALASLAVAAAVVTRMVFALHHDAINLLRQLGATDGYLARQLEQHAWTMGLRGSTVGHAAAMGVLVVAAGPLRGLLPWQGPAPLDWLLMPIVPAMAALLCLAAASLAARSCLRRLG